MNQETGRWGGHLINDWNVTQVQDMNQLIPLTDVKSNFNHNIGGWNVSKVTDMHLMFQNYQVYFTIASRYKTCNSIFLQPDVH